MSLGAEAWWAAMMGAAQFEDGSLVIEDDTLDVDGGSTVNLRVKLGARPRSDVTVALSETSALISLGTASLTFTPANWDSYQSVVVTGVGNRQTLMLPAAWFTVGTGFKRWAGSPRMAIDAGLSPSGTTRVLSNVVVRPAMPFVSFDLDDDQMGGIQRFDLSDAFETTGSVRLVADGQTLAFATSGTDTSDPYDFNPSGGGAFHDDISDTGGAIGLAFTLRDFEPGDATISLAASGPAEYAAVTGIATVTVD